MERSLLMISVLVAACIICYHNSLECGFVFDDIPAIKDNKDLRPSTSVSNLFWNDFWGTPMSKEKSHKSYRPLCVLTFRWNYAVSEVEPMSYHLANMLLHAVVCIMYFRMCGLFVSQTTSFVAALLFAVHPVHTEAVTGVVGRAEILSSIFYLAALMSYAKCTGPRAKTVWSQLVLTVILVSIAMLCKEQGITVIGVCCVYEVFIAQKLTLRQLLTLGGRLFGGKVGLPLWVWEATRRAGFLVTTTVCLLLARIKVMGAQLPVFTKFDNPASVAPMPARHLTYNYLLPLNTWILLNPSYLCCDWTMGTIPLLVSITDVRNLATLAFMGVLAKFVIYSLSHQGQRARAIIMSLALMALPFIPASNLFFPVGFVVAERVLYAPSMGFCLLVALGFELLVKHRQRLKYLLWLAMSGLLLTHSMKTFTRNFDWKSEYKLFQSALKVNKDNAKVYNNIGHVLENEKKYDKALEYFSQACNVQPDDIGAHMNVGRTYNNMGRYEDSEVAYRKALELLPPVKPGQSYTTRIAPNHLNVFLNLANLISKDESRLMEADALYRTAISMRADYTQAYINRGDILMRLNRTKEAQEQYETALRYESDNPDIYYNLGVVMLEQNMRVEALHHFEKALRIDKDHKQTLFNSAVVMQELGDPRLRSEAITRLLKLMKMEPENERIYFNLGMLAMDDKKFDEADAWFKKAVKLKADFRSALFNMALMLVNDLQRPLDAVPYLRQLLEYHPDHTKGLILMGDLNINHLKDIPAAEKNFRHILEYDPENVQANHNLCVVYVEQGFLGKAEACLVHTLQLAPHEGYIQEHLTIVRARLKQQQQQMLLKQQQEQKLQEERMKQLRLEEEKKLEEQKRLKEQARREEEQRLEEERKVQEQERLKEQSRREEEQRIEEERKVREQERLKDQARREEEQRREEQKKLEEQKRLKEQARREEEQRLEKEKRRLEETKRIEEEMRQKDELEKQEKLEEEKRLLAEKERAQQLELEKQKRLEEERRVKEQRRIEEEQRKEEKRKVKNRLAEEKRLQEEKESLQQEELKKQKKQEEQRIVQEGKRLQEEKRKQEELGKQKRLEEETRLRAEKERLQLADFEKQKKLEEQKRLEKLKRKENQEKDEDKLKRQMELEGQKKNEELKQLEELKLQKELKESRERKHEKLKDAKKDGEGMQSKEGQIKEEEGVETKEQNGPNKEIPMHREQMEIDKQEEQQKQEQEDGKIFEKNENIIRNMGEDDEDVREDDEEMMEGEKAMEEWRILDDQMKRKLRERGQNVPEYEPEEKELENLSKEKEVHKKWNGLNVIDIESKEEHEGDQLARQRAMEEMRDLDEEMKRRRENREQKAKQRSDGKNQDGEKQTQQVEEKKKPVRRFRNSLRRVKDEEEEEEPTPEEVTEQKELNRKAFIKAMHEEQADLTPVKNPVMEKLLEEADKEGGYKQWKKPNIGKLN